MATLFVVPMILSKSSAESRIRLSEDVLAQTRGANLFTVLYQASCDGLIGLTPCNLPTDESCVTCERTTYTDLTFGLGGGYAYSALNNATCGNKLFGLCDANRNCVAVVGQAPCADPPAIEVQ